MGILHKYNVGLSGVKPRLHTWVRKCGRSVKSNLGKSEFEIGFKRKSPRKTPIPECGKKKHSLRRTQRSLVCSWLHIWDRQRLLGNLVGNNESFELELSGA